MKAILLFLCLATFSFAGDCTSLTFTTLSALTQHPVSYRAWADDLGTDKQSPSLYTAIAVWNKHFVLTPLECVYSTITAIKSDDQRPLAYNTPYVWIGIVPAKFQANPDEVGVHCALAFFREDMSVDIVHSFRGDGIYFVENLSRHDFFIRTTVIYEVTPKAGLTITWKELPSELFK